MFNIRTRTTLDMSKCVYLIRCATCERKYVGETGNSIACRFYQYKYNIVKQQNKQATEKEADARCIDRLDTKFHRALKKNKNRSHRSMEVSGSDIGRRQLGSIWTRT